MNWKPHSVQLILLLVGLFTEPAWAQWPIGVQLSSMKSSPTPSAMMTQLRQWGVTELEGGWPKTMPVKAYRKLMTENGLRMVSMGTGFKQLQDSVALVASRAKQLGASYVVCYWIPHDEEAFTLANADQAIAVFTKAGQFLGKKGLTLCYHNHGYEFVKHGTGTLFDYLAQQLPAEVVQFELDLMWAHHTQQGAIPQDPVALLKKYPGRFPLVHLKNRRPRTPLSVQGTALRPANVALGQGDLNLNRFLQEARQGGVKHLFIEDESLQPMVQIPQSIAFLRDWDQHKDEIRLLARGDDMGMSHSANRAFLDGLRTGILRSVEVMPTTPWFSEAVTELSRLPDADVGVHLTMTSEWKPLRWGPLTQAPSLTDSAGYFYPTPYKGTALGESFTEHTINYNEVEAELRAQIERVRQALPRQVSHVTCHMGFNNVDPKVFNIVEKLAAEYGLSHLQPRTHPSISEMVPPITGQTLAEREQALVAILTALQPGTYTFVTHPAYDTDEMKPLGEQGRVAAMRDIDTAMLKSKAVQAVIEQRGIRLIDHRTIAQPIGNIQSDTPISPRTQPR